ncbi:WASH complex subunit 5 [Pseudomonas sp. MWU13-2517]|uniref:WASH complex subunit 5 n=1 Tax=Pseudomonas sp. MWU13-2517 TaxID=2929055 RepID=UPI00200E4612|nr:WASH complex subunit 5 [Pseudomonas sp. MWU13-2517]
MSKIDVGLVDPLDEPAGEKVNRVIRIALGTVPIAGGAMVEFFNSMFEGPLSKRRTEWMIQVSDELNEILENGVLTEKDLQENESFISTVAQACNISLRNHELEKLEALRNAVKNSALPNCPDDDCRQLFLNFVDVCTVTHIRLLQFFDFPARWFKSKDIIPPNFSMGSLIRVLEVAIPSLQNRRELYEPIWMDLVQRGLIQQGGLDMTNSLNGLLEKRTTKLGSQLIEFLS